MHASRHRIAGRERFKIVRVVEERPVLVCEVEFLPTEDEKSSPEVHPWLFAVLSGTLGTSARHKRAWLLPAAL